MNRDEFFENTGIWNFWFEEKFGFLLNSGHASLANIIIWNALRNAVDSLVHAQDSRHTQLTLDSTQSSAFDF